MWLEIEGKKFFVIDEPMTLFEAEKKLSDNKAELLRLQEWQAIVDGSEEFPWSRFGMRDAVWTATRITCSVRVVWYVPPVVGRDSYNKREKSFAALAIGKPA